MKIKIPKTAKKKLTSLKTKAATLWKDKKNRKIILFVVGAVLIYMTIKSKARAAATDPTSGTKTPDAIILPTIPLPISGSNRRVIYMNATGYGFSTNDPTGIASEWRERVEAFRNLNQDGVAFSGIDGFVLCIQWSDYEPNEGVFNDTHLRAAINWCAARNLIFSVCFWALRDSTDSFLPASDRATGSNGQMFNVVNRYTLAPYSALGKQKLYNTVRHIAQVMKEFSNTDYIRLGIGNTEEFFLPSIQTFNPSSIIALTGYSVVDRAAWTSYAATHGIAGVQPPVSPDASNPWTTGDYWNTPNGKLWFEFLTDGLASVFASFRDGVKAGGGKACAVFADCGAAQSSWYLSYHINRIFAGCDVAYSSDGGTIYDLDRKQLAADLIRGTFANAECAIEIDQEDIAADSAHKDYGDPVNGELLYQTFKAAFNRGVNIAHLSMAFRPDTVPQMASALYRLKNEVRSNSAFVPSIIQGAPINFTINSFSGDAGYNALWFAQGGSKTKQIKIVLS